MSHWLLFSPWSYGLLALAVLVLLGTLLIRAWREQRLVRWPRQTLPLLLRLATIMLLLWIALNPTVFKASDAEHKPVLAVLVDTSASMATQDVRDQSRWQAAAQRLGDTSVLDSLQRAFDLSLSTFDQQLQVRSLADLSSQQAKGLGSDLGAALTTTITELAEYPSRAGVLLISDGRSTTGRDVALEAARLAMAKSVPLWTWTLGGQVPQRDVWVEASASEVLAFADDPVEILGQVRQVGYDALGFEVQLKKGDQVVAREQVIPDAHRVAAVRFEVTAPQTGEDRYVLHVVPQVDEADAQNNDRSIFVRSVGRKVRVLVVEGQPHWDTKFLVQTLKRNRRVEMTAVYRLSENKQFAVVSKQGRQTREIGDLFPRTADAFRAYDVIIMGRGCDAFFDDQTEALLTDFVGQHGGGLIFSRGKSYGGRFRPLAKLEPVVWGETTQASIRMDPVHQLVHNPVQAMSLDGQIDAMLERLPQFDLVRDTVGIKPLAVIWAEGIPEGAAASQSNDRSDHADQRTAVMAYHRYGQGTVVTINASGLWRWGFNQRTQHQDDAAYERLWLGLLRWMLTGADFLAGHDVALRSERRIYTDRQPLRMLVRTRGLDRQAYRPRLTITHDRESTRIEPQAQADGTYLAEAGPFDPGTYTLTLENNLGQPSSLSTTVQVISASIEHRNLSADPQLMQQLADTSQGMAIESDQLARLADIVNQWRARQHLDEQKYALWDTWWLLALIVGLLTLEWYRRRQEGLL